jgi:hypothetical protein
MVGVGSYCDESAGDKSVVTVLTLYRVSTFFTGKSCGQQDLQSNRQVVSILGVLPGAALLVGDTFLEGPGANKMI